MSMYYNLQAARLVEMGGIEPPAAELTSPRRSQSIPPS